jgi:hypothetical protein
VIAIHDPAELAVAVHELILVAVTVAEPVWPEAVIDAVVGAIVNDGVPCCVTINVAGVAPAEVRVIVPCRLDEPVLACAAYVSVELPAPPEPPIVIVSHEPVEVAVAVHAPTFVAVTVAVPVCAEAVSEAGLGNNGTMAIVGGGGAVPC